MVKQEMKLFESEENGFLIIVKPGEKHPEDPKLANMATHVAKLAANLIVKNDANLALLPESRRLMHHYNSCGRPGLSGMKLCLMIFHYWYDDTQQIAPWETWHWERGFELFKTFELVKWGLGGSGHVEGTGEKLSFASQAAR
ncbi:hypothetical protein TNCV_3074021 [Trichonephila clavipes]|uniref:Uncharacterized protein n=1 Tax=Trichonephila clavipes TaxID=2585209 RepID=A0A8X6SFE6_TRICX|nr:hypothetical protein TNCV_3074021 [Trichonephila clavipes]